MNSSMVELSPVLQSLVDERLDSIERILLAGGVSRGERRGILSEVESHVFELLSRRATGEPTREDVLAVLSQLDPPESYAPEGFDRRKLNEAFAPPKRRERELSLLAAGSALAGGFLLCVLVFCTQLRNEEPFLMTTAVLFANSVVGAWSLYRVHRSGGWLYGVRPAFFATLIFPILAANLLVLLLWNGLGRLSLVIGAMFIFATLNGSLLYAAWRLYLKLLQNRPAQPSAASHAD
jgi:hypothetical protein